MLDHLRLGAVDQQLQAFARVRIGLGLGDGLSGPSSPSRAVLLQVVTRNAARQIDARRKKIQRPMLIARMNTAIGVCSNTAPSVPPSTINAAGPLSNAEIWPPSKSCPDNGDERKQQPDKAEYVHQMQASARLRPMSSRPYTASLRLAFTTAIGMP